MYSNMYSPLQRPVILVQHKVGLYNDEIFNKISPALINAINSKGLKSRDQLIKEKIVNFVPMKGLFTDEHANIYFYPMLNDVVPKQDINAMYCDLGYYIKLYADETIVYNSGFRGFIDYYLYKASATPYSIWQANALKLDDNSFLHPLTSKIIYNATDDKYKQFSYMPEVIINTPIIKPHYFSFTPLSTNFCDYNTYLNSSVYIQDKIIQRGIFTDDEGIEYLVPMKNNITDDYYKIELTNELHRYDCVENDIFDPDDSYFKYIIKGDNDNNIIKIPSNADMTLAIGGLGEDIFVLPGSNYLTIIADFSNVENDIISFPSNLYALAEDILADIVYKGDQVLIPTGELGFVILDGVDHCLTASSFHIHNTYDNVFN